jgi:hypothetical protein
VIDKSPPADGVNVTWHLARAVPDTAARLHVPPLEKVPVFGGELNVTVPVGGMFKAVSLTVAVQTVPVPVAAGDGEQLSAVVVASSAAAAGAPAPSAPAVRTSASNPMRRTRGKAAYSGMMSW